MSLRSSNGRSERYIIFESSQNLLSFYKESAHRPAPVMSRLKTEGLFFGVKK